MIDTEVLGDPSGSPIFVPEDESAHVYDGALLVILKKEYSGPLPVGVRLQLPFRQACSLLMHRLATPVGDTSLLPEFAYDDDGLLYAQLDDTLTSEKAA